MGQAAVAARSGDDLGARVAVLARPVHVQSALHTSVDGYSDVSSGIWSPRAYQLSAVHMDITFAVRHILSGHNLLRFALGQVTQGPQLLQDLTFLPGHTTGDRREAPLAGPHVRHV
jgi:hypothetical protein